MYKDFILQWKTADAGQTVAAAKVKSGDFTSTSGSRGNCGALCITLRRRYSMKKTTKFLFTAFFLFYLLIRIIK